VTHSPRIRAAAAIAALLLATNAKAAEPVRLEGIARVIDGDTIAIGPTRIRLAGIDAPEHGQLCQDSDNQLYPCGDVATAEMHSMAEGQVVACTSTQTDKYRRLIATCWTATYELGREMVRRGQAIAYRRYSLAYVAEEDEAREAHRGIWQGPFLEPERWRHGER
jgi:endonuclease YncB( thermonuclease family)